MYKYEEINKLHLEITSSCNASCPLCPRNIAGGLVNPNLPITELTVDDAKAIFPPAFIRQLKLMYMCGNYGDPLVARDTIQVLEYFREINAEIRLGLFTNGSARAPQWWERLASIVDFCRFSIDGLEDTNHLYRRGTNWERILQNALAFIQAGGRAEWDFIVFRHNEHQVDSARTLSRRMGFANFTAKKTYRFQNLNTGHQKERSPVVDRDGSIQYFIEGPSSEAFRNPALVELNRVATANGYDSYLAHTEIRCKAAQQKMLYVSAEGLVFPCCWTAHIYPASKPTEATEVGRLLHRLPGGKSAVNAKLHALKDIVGGPFFQQLIPEGWRSVVANENRLEVCARICGDLDMYSAQYPGSSK